MGQSIEQYLERLESSREDLGKANGRIEAIIELKRTGYSRNAIKNRIQGSALVNDFLLEVSEARMRCISRYSMWRGLWLDSYSAMYATPEMVGKYRAGRLKGYEVVDIGCGAGLQAIMFSMVNTTTGIEPDAIRYRLARLNRMVYGAENLHLVNGRFPDVNRTVDVHSGSVVFSDPLRPHRSSIAKLSELLPDPEAIVNKLSGKTEHFVFDLPPMMSIQNFPFPGELEYISTNGSVSRLTYYSSSFSDVKRRAVILPDMKVISGDPENVNLKVADAPGDLILLPDQSVIRAGLLSRVTGIENLALVQKDGRRMVLTGKDIDGKSFPGEIYQVAGQCTRPDLVAKLKSLYAGKVFFRFPIQTEAYYELKNQIERELNGELEYYIFKREEELIITRRLRKM